MKWKKRREEMVKLMHNRLYVYISVLVSVYLTGLAASLLAEW